MKNLFILPTDKPSRLCFRNYYFINKDNIGEYNNVEFKNIYITCDEEIKGFENNIWVYNNGRVWLWQNTMALRSDNKPKKIILTTDQDLIKDGVQAIDDEFLEWFVKNPSCEKVEVETDIKWKSTVYDQPDIEDGYIYKLIIPKEEPNFYEKLVEYFKNTPREKVLEDWNKTAECDNIGPTVEEFLDNKEETLEQAAVRLYPDNIIKLGNETSYNAALLKRKDFIDGGNWVKERMYSEEDLVHLLNFVSDEYNIGNGIGWFYTHDFEDVLSREVLDKWFEQFKKK